MLNNPKSKITKKPKCTRYVDTYSGNYVKRRKAKTLTNGVTEGVLKADGINSVYLGKSSIRNGSRKQRYTKPPLEANMHYGLNSKIFDEYDINVDKCVISHGCYKTNMHILQRQLIPEVADGKHCEYPTMQNLSIYDEAVFVVLRKLKRLSGLPCVSFKDIYETELSPDKKPGFRFEEEYNMSTKRRALKAAMTLAKRRWDAITNTCWKNKARKLLDRDKIFPGVYTIGARNKRDHTFEEDELTSSRVVHMPELHCELTSSPWCDLITQRILNLSTGSIYIGNNILKWHRFNEDIKKSKFLLEGDWRRYDSTLYINMITMVVSIMRTFFPHNNSYIDKHFIAMYDTLAIKDYYVPGGKVFRAYHGLPSGVKSTALVNSIANMLSLVFCVGPKISKSFNFIVGGDDFVIGCNSNNYDQYKVSEMIEDNATKLGMKLKFLKIKYYNSKRIEDCATFYKYCIYEGTPVVPTSSVLERVFMPWNKTYADRRQYYKFLKDVQPSLGTPKTHLLLYYHILKKLTYDISGIKLSYSEIIKAHTLQYFKMSDKDSANIFKYKDRTKIIASRSVGYFMNLDLNRDKSNGFIKEFISDISL